MSLFGDVTHCRKTLCVALQALLIGVDPMTQKKENTKFLRKHKIYFTTITIKIYFI